MGANVRVIESSAIITGVDKLVSARVNATDLRAGAAMVIAALMAEGETEIGGVEYILRGYERFDEKLRKLGACVQSVSSRSYARRLRIILRRQHRLPAFFARFFMLIADLHIHSRFSRATSRECDAPHLDLWARRKGVGLVGTGDFTHPAWRKELSEALEEAGEGVFALKKELRLPCETALETRFVLSAEISSIYKRDGRTRKVHNVILMPSFAAADRLSARLERVGNLHSDGRPILGLDCRDLLEMTLEACPEAIFIPAHIWTPHFSLLGAFSGFDSIEECFGDLSGYIRALETGLSSDPPMNWRVSDLDGRTLVSNSDAHSPAKLAREANLLSVEAGYPALKRAIETGEGFEGTIEFFPEEGKYHLDGHRACAVCLEPSETMRLEGRCPACGRKLTIGVKHRAELLADRPEGCPPPASGRPFESLMPLPEVLASCMGVSSASKKVMERYFQLLAALGSELYILREAPLGDLRAAGGWELEEGVRRLRAGKVLRKSGYDGEYGVISLFAPGELEVLGGQMAMFDMAAAPEKPRSASVRARKAAEKAADRAPRARPQRRAAPRRGIAGKGAGGRRRPGHGQDLHARRAHRPPARNRGQAVARDGGHVYQPGGAGIARAP